MKKTIFIIALLGLSGCSILFEKQNVQRDPATPYGSRSARIEQAQSLSFSKLKSIVLEQNIASVESLLQYLGENHHEYLKFHTLMYNSLSLHESSFEEPRAIVFGPDARFVITFNGNNDQRSGNAVEVMEFSEATQAFEFREIAFKSSASGDHEDGLSESEIEIQTERLLISKPNPDKCLACHGPSANPIWATYFVWPGAYGSNDDHLTTSFNSKDWNPNNLTFFSQADRPHSQGRGMLINSDLPDAEVEGIGRYVANKPSHPRYKWLPKQFYEDSLLDYFTGEKFSNVDASVKAMEESKRAGLSGAWPSRPNLFFQMALMELNQERIIKELEAKGLKGAFASEAWTEWYTFREVPVLSSQNRSVDETLNQTAEAIENVLVHFPTTSSWPSVAQIKIRLTKDLQNEMRMQFEKVALHEASLGLGSNALTLYSQSPLRFELESLGDAMQFYSRLLNKPQLKEIEKIASRLEGGHIPSLTLISILLEDKGVNLESFNLNLRQMGFSFHTGGLYKVMEYLGVPLYL